MSSQTQQTKIIPRNTLTTSTTGQTSGMTRLPAITASASINSSIMLAAPHSQSDIHHHGDQDTIIYAVRGRGAIVTEGGNKKEVLEEGSFALIPAWKEHREVNDGEEEVEWVIVRSGREAFVQNLEGWS